MQIRPSLSGGVRSGSVASTGGTHGRPGFLHGGAGGTQAGGGYQVGASAPAKYGKDAQKPLLHPQIMALIHKIRLGGQLPWLSTEQQ